MSTTIYNTPPSWAPPLSTPICPQRLCNPSCPFWCLLPPPSPPTFFQEEDPPSSSSTSLSPLVISVIGILSSALLLLSYYAFVSRYCTSRNSQEDEEVLQQGRHTSVEVGHSRQEAWQVQEGLDEAVIRSIATCKYREGDGFVEGKECSVCLGEFREEEEVRLLPRCCHAFHVECIDQWLKGHTSCPVCRANVPPVAMEVLMEVRHSRWSGGGESCVVVVGEKGEEGSILHV